MEIKCLICNKSIDYSKNQKIKDLVTSILNASSESEKSNIKAWEEEIYPCEHTLTLNHNEGVKIANNHIQQSHH